MTIQAVILCGGKGTRLKPYTNLLPKPLIDCNGKPFLFYLLEQLHSQGIRRFVLLTGYLGQKIYDYFGTGEKWGWDIKYSHGPEEWDTGRRIWEAKKILDNFFLLLYGDNYASFNLKKAMNTHRELNTYITFMTKKKKPGNLSIDKFRKVINYDNDRNDSTLEYVELGYMFVEKMKMFEYYLDKDCSFSEILKRMVSDGSIGAYFLLDEYNSISDPSRWKKTCDYLLNKKIILLDRDGVINKKAGKGEYITTVKELEWIDDTKEALKILSTKGFRFIVISNQAGIARGYLKNEDVRKINQKIYEDARSEGISILDFLYCPHGWDEGCLCRKPSPGMLFEASKKYKFRLDKTLFIGDDIRDCKAAYNAGAQSILIGNSDDLDKLETLEKPILVSDSLLKSIDKVEKFYSY